MRTRSVTFSPTFRSTLNPQTEKAAAILAAIQPLKTAPTNGIAIPGERTHKQRNYAFCANPECAEDGQEFRFEIEHTLMPCPKCGATKPPFVGMLAKTHLLVRDRKGHIEGTGGLRYRIACDTQNKRHRISTITNHELATGERDICNCIDCLTEANRINAGSVAGYSLESEG
jgi:hypothetical protein